MRRFAATNSNGNFQRRFSRAIGFFVLLCFADSALAQSVLFVSSSVVPGSRDAPIVDRLTSQGYIVTVMDDDVVQETDSLGMGVIIVSSSVSSSKIGGKFNTTAIPLVTWEAWLFDDLGMTSWGSGTNYGATSATQYIDVVGTHPLAAGLSGSTAVTTADRLVRFGVPASSAVVAATVTGDPGRAAIFAYEPGDAMVTRDAPARRVGFFFGDTTSAVWTSEGQALFDAAVSWATGPLTNQPPVVSAGGGGDAFVGIESILPGSVTDDNVTGLLTVQWRQISGPGTATIRDPGQASTTVVFDQPGVYELELEADDDEFIVFDTAIYSVTTPPTNQPPTVSVNDGSAFTGTEVPLSGTVLDDDIASPLLIQWTLLSGPGGAVIADPNQASTTVTFDSSGIYSLELSADDGEFVDQAIATFDVSAAAPTTDVLFVSGIPGGSSGDAPLISHLASQGYNVTVVDDDLVQTSDALSQDLIVVSSTVSSGKVGDKFTSTATPLVTWEAWLFDDLGMVNPGAGTNYGSAPSGNTVDVAGSHPLSAGLSGSVVVTSSDRRIRWGIPAPNAIVAAMVTGDPSRAAIFGYEPGDFMATHTAPARRVGFFFDDSSATAWTVEGQALFDAAVSWAIGPLTNQPPVVSAGGGGSVFVAIESPLPGSVSDDGLTNSLTVQWSQISGPGIAEIASPDQASTTVIFDQPGIYELQLQADDVEFVVFDSAVYSVTTPPANQSPVVSANDGVAFVGVLAALNGAVVDDGISLPLVNLWTQLSGPGLAVISDPNEASTTVTFDAPGVYALELSSDDGEFTDQAVATFDVTIPPPATNVLFVSGASIPADHDRVIINQLEFWGYTVTVVEDDFVQEADSLGMDLILVSSTVRSGKVGDKFNNTAVPLVTWEAWLFDNLGLTSGGSGTNYGSTSSQLTIEVTGTHPLTAGFSGSTIVTTSARQVRWGIPAPSAVVAATVVGSPSSAAIFGYETGDAMVSRVAPARRVGFFFDDTTTLAWTADAVSLLQAAVAWAVGETATPIVRVMALGDSVTRGTGGYWSYRNTLWNLLTADACAVDLVGTLNGPDSGMPGPGLFDRDHEGHSGFRTDQIATSLPAGLGGNVPNIALVHAGTNDILQQTSLAAAKENIRAMIGHLRAANPNVIVIVAQIIPSTEGREADILALNASIVDLAAEEDTIQSPVYVVDQYTGYDNAIHNSDNIHPNDLGDALMADRWYFSLRPLIDAYCD